jgi:hypothetical protein
LAKEHFVGLFEMVNREMIEWDFIVDAIAAKDQKRNSQMKPKMAVFKKVVKIS